MFLNLLQIISDPTLVTLSMGFAHAVHHLGGLTRTGFGEVIVITGVPKESTVALPTVERGHGVFAFVEKIHTVFLMTTPTFQTRTAMVGQVVVVKSFFTLQAEIAPAQESRQTRDHIVVAIMT